MLGLHQLLLIVQFTMISYCCLWCFANGYHSRQSFLLPYWQPLLLSHLVLHVSLFAIKASASC